MALTSLIAEIWSASFLQNLDNNMVYGNVINRDYQSDLVYGSIVHVDKIGPITIDDYVKNTNLTAAEVLDSVQTDLTIDQQKAFNFQIDSIDEAQSRPSVMAEAMGRAAYAMANAVDTHLGSFYASATVSQGTAAAPIVPDADTIYGIMTTAAKDLDAANVPTTGRYIVMDAAGIKLLRDSVDLLVATPYGDILRASGGLTTAPAPNGYVGMAAGFQVWMSNNTPTDTAATSIWQAGHPMAISMAESVNEIVGYNMELRFGQAVKGLYVYGAQAMQPDAFTSIYTAIA